MKLPLLGPQLKKDGGVSSIVSSSRPLERSTRYGIVKSAFASSEPSEDGVPLTEQSLNKDGETMKSLARRTFRPLSLSWGNYNKIHDHPKKNYDLVMEENQLIGISNKWHI